MSRGDLEVLGQLPFSSNHVFLVRGTSDDDEALGVYKPIRGERPLWDFPVGTLAARETAAYLISETLGWELVPATVMRADAPLGPGSVQVFIDHDPEVHYFTLVSTRAGDLVRFAAFDVVINNADRKAGHVVEDADGRLWGVDHGLGFNVTPKLRTVIWAFAGQRVPTPIRDDLASLAQALEDGGPPRVQLEGLLEPAEVAETAARARVLADDGVFPTPEGPFSVPWPLV